MVEEKEGEKKEEEVVERCASLLLLFFLLLLLLIFFLFTNVSLLFGLPRACVEGLELVADHANDKGGRRWSGGRRGREVAGHKIEREKKSKNIPSKSCFT